MLISKDELNNLESNDLVPFECEICKSTFYKKKHYALRGLKGTRNYSACSKECWKKVIGNRHRHECITLTCDWCKKEFQRKPNLHLRRKKMLSQHCFCSRKCSYLYRQSDNSFGKRSTLEKWIEQKLTVDFPTISIEYNNITTINGELDIFIPTLDLAFEINGVGHYKPIYGVDNFKKRIKKDGEKIEECLARKIDLFVIDCKEFNTLKEDRDIKYYNRICEEISRKWRAVCG